MGKLATRSRLTAYQDDYHAWLMGQIELLRSGALSRLDAGNLAEELKDLGNAQKREVESRLAVLLPHLLKWQHQPDQRSNSWRATIMEQRRRIAREIAASPSLARYPAEVLADEYEIARLRASGETGLAVEAFPEARPYAAAQALDDEFWPESK